MRTGPRAISRSVSTLCATVLAAILAVGACTSSTQTPSSAHPTTAAGFPLGSYAKEVEDREFGRIRLVWTFDGDGRFAEVPFALDGQTSMVPPTRGTYVVDDQTLTIALDWPPDWGTSHHGWRMDGDRLWTFFMSSDIPDDKDWFESLDSRPWIPYQ